MLVDWDGLLVCWLIGMACRLVGVKDFVVDEDAWMPLVDEDTAAKP